MAKSKSRHDVEKDKDCFPHEEWDSKLDELEPKPPKASYGKPAPKCYVCNGDAAEYVRIMRTPSGGAYPRGWCTVCLDSSGAASEGRKLSKDGDGGDSELRRAHMTTAEASHNRLNEMKDKPGRKVHVSFDATILHHTGGRTPGYMLNVNGTAIEIPKKIAERVMEMK